MQPATFLEEAFASANAPPPIDMAHGTTTLAFVFKGGVIVAVDSRATMGSYIGSQHVKKIIERLGKAKKFKGPRMKPMQRPSTHHPGNDDVAELYSPPRVTEMAGTMGMEPGFALDLTKDDEDDGEP